LPSIHPRMDQKRARPKIAVLAGSAFAVSAVPQTLAIERIRHAKIFHLARATCLRGPVLARRSTDGHLHLLADGSWRSAERSGTPMPTLDPKYPALPTAKVVRIRRASHSVARRWLALLAPPSASQREHARRLSRCERYRVIIGIQSQENRSIYRQFDV
jgi:hypothetical protein